jgi:hypothetical protein
MAPFTRRKSKKQQAGDLLVNYLKLKAAGKAAKGAKKAAKGTAVYQVSKRTPFVKRVPLIVGAGIAALVATKIVRGRGGDPAAA